MSLSMDNGGTGFYMPVAPAYAGANNGLGGFGGDGWWIILLLLFAGGGWGNGFGGGFGNAQLGYDFPWLLNGQNNINANTNNGFRDQMINSGINNIQNSLTSGFGDVQNSLCSGFAGVNSSISAAQNALQAQMYTNQLADLERSFNAQTATTQGMSNIQSQLTQCCCENKAATADVKYTIATEACSNRATSTANTQAILDKLCQLELDNYKTQVDSKNDTIAQLRSELAYARGQASQDVQTARILAGQTNEVDALYNRLSNCPVPSTPVYGRTPIFTCNNGGCGCGM